MNKEHAKVLLQGPSAWNKYVSRCLEENPNWRADLYGADLREASLEGACLNGAYLKGADLYRSNLGRADLNGSNLQGANLYGASLQGANLYGSSLEGADLSGASLQGAYLKGADLYGSNLRGASLEGAYLEGADLENAKYSISQILLSQWGEVSQELCCQLMRLDAEALPNGYASMASWARGGDCPLNEQSYQRVAYFTEKREHWAPGRPWSLWKIWEKLSEEKGVKISK